MSYARDNDVVFDGECNDLTSDAFIRHIRRTVLTEGIQDDDRRVAQTAASCLGGEALEWYEDQSEEMQESWKLLRRAILVRWPIKPRSSTSSGINAPAPPTATIPTPAAAPPPPPQGQTAASPPPVATSTSVAKPATKGSNIYQAVAQRLLGTGETAGGGSSVTVIDPVYVYRVRALYHYKASPDDPNEISFAKGDIMGVANREGKWWQVKKADGKTGIAPSNYLQVI